MTTPVRDPALSPEEVREVLAGQRWTAHNIELAPEVWTLPGEPDFVQTNLHLISMTRFLNLLFGDVRGLRVADLGCLEGGFALAFARLGADVVGVEVRDENMAKCRLVERQAGLPNLRFEQADVKDFTVQRFGRFDVVLAMGILYHLDDPVTWIKQVAEATEGVLYVDTHVAPPAAADLEALDPRLKALGPLERREFPAVYEGRWFPEHTQPEHRDQMPWSSYSNAESFWLTKQALLTVIARARFDIVLEQYENWPTLHDHHQAVYPRAFVAGVRSAGARAIAERRRQR
jgi:SAM-dependent methyltransferase